MTTKIIFSIFMLFAAMNLNAQVIQEWVRTYNGSANNNDEPAAIIYDGQGNVIITGRVVSTGNNTDYCTIKYNQAGVQQWAVVFNSGATNYDEAHGVTADNSGNIYVTGQSLFGSTNYDIVLIKYNSAGVQQWVKTWNGISNQSDIPAAVTSDNAGNVYITGNTQTTSNNYNYITLKYNPNGDLQWAKEYNSPINNYDAAEYVEADANGNVYVTGTSTAQTTGSDFLTIKYNSQGDSSWVRRYSGTTASNEIPQGFDVDPNGNVYVTGFTTGTGGSIDFATIKYNASGVQQWVIQYDSTHGQDIPEDLETDANGNVYVTGRTRINSNYNDFVTIKYSTAGVRQWIKVYGNTMNNLDDYGYDLELDNQGNVYVAGYTNWNGADSDPIVIKYDNNGVEKWIARHNSTNDEEAYGIVLDDNNNVYITGYSDSLNADIFTIKYSQSIGINPISTEVPENYSLSQNYPNPFNPVTHFKFEIASSGFVSIKVYDMLGNEVSTIVNEQLPGGTYETDFNGENFSSGSYFYKMTAGNFTGIKKMILIK